MSQTTPPSQQQGFFGSPQQQPAGFGSPQPDLVSGMGYQPATSGYQMPQQMAWPTAQQQVPSQADWPITSGQQQLFQSPQFQQQQQQQHLQQPPAKQWPDTPRPMSAEVPLRWPTPSDPQDLPSSQQTEMQQWPTPNPNSPQNQPPVPNPTPPAAPTTPATPAAPVEQAVEASALDDLHID